MTEVIVILALLVFLGYREWRHEKHIKELEEKIMVSVPGYVHFRKGKKPKEAGVNNEIMEVSPNEIMLGDIPHMEIPKDFKIETEGSPETPAEVVARKGN